MKKMLRIGSRESKLAIIQSEIVINLIKEKCPQYDIELITMKTTGDKILDRTLDKIGGKGLFVKELDKALYENKVDITVHSLKDVPMEVDENIPIMAFLKRENPFDVLVLPKGATEIDFSKPIGSSSLRRSLQFKNLYKEAYVNPVRGNVITRLSKLDNGDYSALLLAYAGLKRLNLENRINKVFNESEIIPQAGQGIIAVQGRKGEFQDIIKVLNDKNSEICANAERTVVKALGGGCSEPIGAFSKINGNLITIKAFYEINGREIIKDITGNVNEYESLGKNLASKILEVI